MYVSMYSCVWCYWCCQNYLKSCVLCIVEKCRLAQYCRLAWMARMWWSLQLEKSWPVPARWACQSPSRRQASFWQMGPSTGVVHALVAWPRAPVARSSEKPSLASTTGIFFYIYIYLLNLQLAECSIMHYSVCLSDICITTDQQLAYFI